MDDISFSIDIVDHLLMDIRIDLAIEDGDRYLIEDKFLLMDIVLLEEARTEEIISIGTYTPFLIISFIFQIADKVI